MDVARSKFYGADAMPLKSNMKDIGFSLNDTPMYFHIATVVYVVRVVAQISVASLSPDSKDLEVLCINDHRQTIEEFQISQNTCSQE